MRHILLSLLLSCLLAVTPRILISQEPVDTCGGWTEHQLSATDRFRIADWRGGKWLVTPQGHPFILTAVAHAKWPPPERRVDNDVTGDRFNNDPLVYADDLLQWADGAGFNSLTYGLPPGTEGKAPTLGELGLLRGFILNTPDFPDIFNPALRDSLALTIARRVPAMRQNTKMIGYVLSWPQMVSPAMMLPYVWKRIDRKPENHLMAIKALPAEAAGKQAYVNYLRQTYGSYNIYEAYRGAIPEATSFEDLLDLDLSVYDHYGLLHTDDAEFYSQMWSELTRFLVAEIRKHDPDGLIFSYRIIGLRQWPDPWINAFAKGVGPWVDGFTLEVYGNNRYRAIVDDLTKLTGKPSLFGDGMRPREFNYPDSASDEDEAKNYEQMFTSLLASPGFLGGSVCQYQDHKLPGPHYNPRPYAARLGIRRPDLTDRLPLLKTYQRLHARKYPIRYNALKE
jgi:hypothetical protein